MRVALLAFIGCAARAAALAVGAPSALNRALSRGQRVIVELLPDAPSEAFDLTDLSARLRSAGASAVVVPPALLADFSREQASAKGDFPGPIPVVCEAELGIDAARLGSLRSEGASGVAVRCDEAAAVDGGLEALLEASSAASLDVLVLVDSAAARARALAAGAALVACDYAMADGASAEPSADGDGGDGGGGVCLGVWTGDDDELFELRDRGYSVVLLADGVGADLRSGSAWCEGRVRAALSKGSRQWSGSMFGATSDEVVPPSQRNPRLWAQSQRQAREMMVESARSRDLPPPTLKKQARFSR